ncbi:MAG: site-2 protease family protein [Fimbriimonadaceae bacterium]|nr:site-2 protease family protein [Fimbriimonadaceae bacterium]
MPPIQSFLSLLIVGFLAIGLHEYAHAKLADLAGDPTPRYFGRVTLNLTKHFELFGTIMLFFTALTGFGIGWGKPVPMDPRKMRNPKWDHFVAVLGGPLTNLLQAAVFALVWRAVTVLSPALLNNGFVFWLLFYGVVLNLGLCLFNLLPIGPLDGMWLLGTFLPEPARLNWTRFNLTFGSIVLLGAVFLGQASGFSLTGMIIRPAMRVLFKAFTGTPLPI